VFVAEQDDKQQGFERITLYYVDGGVPRIQAFSGRWLISPEQWLEARDDDRLETSCYAVAITAKNNVAVFNFVIPRHDEGFR
jgi:hypothetical protein